MSDEGHLKLEKKVTDLAVAVVGLRGVLEQVGRTLREDVDGLEEEIQTQRVLAKFARRTWFEVMTWIALFTLHASDLARRYCLPPQPGAPPAQPAACDVIFWTTSHDAGTPWWRVLGLVLTAALLVFMWHRSQVPEDVLHRVPGGAKRGRA